MEILRPTLDELMRDALSHYAFIATALELGTVGLLGREGIW